MSFESRDSTRANKVESARLNSNQWTLRAQIPPFAAAAAAAANFLHTLNLERAHTKFAAAAATC